MTEPAGATAEAVAEASVPAAGGTLAAGEAIGGAPVEGMSPEPVVEPQVTAPPEGSLQVDMPEMAPGGGIAGENISLLARSEPPTTEELLDQPVVTG